MKNKDVTTKGEAAPRDAKSTDVSGSESPKSHADLSNRRTGQKIEDPYEGAKIGQFDPEPVLREMQDKADAVHRVGFTGYNVDPTPNENYSVSGVLQGKPTPETHDMQDAVVARAREATRLTSPNPDKDGTVPGGDTPPKG